MDCCTSTQCRGGRVGPRAAPDDCGEKKIFPLPEFAPPSIQPVVSCYTEYTTHVPFGAKVQTFLLLPEEYVLWLNTLN